MVDSRLKSIEAGRKRIQAIILHLRTMDSVLLSHLNASPALPINWLPEDILRLIFHTVSRFDAVAMFAISHTCTSWRRLAISAPEMWSVLTFRYPKGKDHPVSDREAKYQDLNQTMGPKLVDLVIVRSGTTNLTVRHTGHPTITSQWHAAALDKLQGCMSRLVELDITVFSNILTDSWILTTPAPVLTKLYVQCVLNRPGSSPVIPKIFAGQTPKLNVLVLRGARVAWNADAIPPTLKHLAVDESISLTEHGRCLRPPEPGDLQLNNDRNLVLALQKCPNLEILSIITCFNIQCGSSDENMVQVSLPRLRSVKLDLSFVDCLYVLKFLNCANLSFLSIVNTFLVYGRPRVLPSLSLLPQVDDILGKLAFFQSITVSNFGIWASPNQDIIRFSSFHDEGLVIELDFSVPGVPRKPSVLQELLQLVPHFHTHTLTMSSSVCFCHEWISPSQVIHMIKRISSLRRLVLYDWRKGNNAMATLWEELQSACEQFPQLLASLEAIHLENCWFRHKPMVDLLCDRRLLPNLTRVEILGVTLDCELEKSESRLRKDVPYLCWERVVDREGQKWDFTSSDEDD